MFKAATIKKRIGLFKVLLNDNDRKPIPQLITEVTRMAIRQKCIPTHYVARYVYKKDRGNFFDYLPNKFLYNIKAKFNEREVTEVVENKLFFNFFYGQFGINLPKTIMYNHKKIFVIDNRNFEVNSSAEFKSLLLNLIPNNNGSLFVKRTYGTYGGDRVYKILGHQLTANPKFVEDLYHEVVSSAFLFQETIQQHPVMDKLNPSCINTIRIDTFIDREGNIEIISGHLRFSINNLHVDNISSGGCAVAVDIDTGQLQKYGYLTLEQNGGKLLTRHPLTKTVFENFTIPQFNKAKEMVLYAASLMPGLRLCGWDVGISESGPVLIEGNSDYDIHGSDLMYGGYQSNPVFRKALQEVGYIK